MHPIIERIVRVLARRLTRDQDARIRHSAATLVEVHRATRRANRLEAMLRAYRRADQRVGRR